MMKRTLLRCAVLVAWIAPVVRADVPLLERDVLPILTKNCLGCHGGIHKHGQLDLRTLPAMVAGGESGPALETGQPDKSLLWKRIVSDEMPEGENREKLSAADKATIKAWIAAGLPTVGQQIAIVDPLLPSDRRHEPAEVAATIDRHLDQFLSKAKLTAVEASDDQEFLRRLYLDLTGRVPTPDQAAEFLDSTEPDKRSKLIDALLATPQFGEQLGRTWRDWICPPELPSDDNGGAQPYQQANALGKWMGEKFAAGEPWHKIARDILTVKGDIKQNPQVIFFALAGEGGKATPDGTARAVASLFLGVQLQCSQCHDDPYRDWSQREHWGLAAFFGNSRADFGKVETDGGAKWREIVIPKSAFRNVGQPIPAAFLGSSSAPTDRDPRESLADWMTAADNTYFARSFVNRVWFSLFARGIVNPVDDFRELNPPSHPGLLKLLASEFTASGCDVKHLFRCLCHSRAYQRTSRVPPRMDEVARGALTAAFGRMPLKVMTADRFLDSLKLAYGESKEFDLRAAGKDNTTGQAATVADAYLEFHRKFGTNEDDATDFTHGIAQMLTLINHPRLLNGSKSLDEYLKRNPSTSPEQVVERLYLSTLSRRPETSESAAAVKFVNQSESPARAYAGVLWMLVNRSEFVLVR